MGDLVAVAQRPPAAAGLKLSGVHPNATQYQQPPPTVRVVAQATATPQIVAVATVTPQEVAQATATPQEVTQATAIPQATATPQAVAQATSTAQPTATANVFDQAAVVVTATPDPSPAMPAAVPAPTSTTSEATFEMPGNAQYFTITGYTATGSRTATGTIPRWGTVAVDPHVIPLGSTVYIHGLGIFRAEDTGGAVIGHHVDVFESTVADAYAITGVRLVGWIPPR